MRWLARRWKLLLASAVLLVALAFAYTPAKQFHRFFLTTCAANGPTRETELDVNPAPVDMREYYAALSSAANGLAVREIAQAEYQNERWPIFLIGPASTRGEKDLAGRRRCSRQ